MFRILIIFHFVRVLIMSYFILNFVKCYVIFQIFLFCFVNLFQCRPMFFSFGCFVSLKCFLINVPHLDYLFYYYLFHFIIWAQGPFHFKSNLRPIGGLFFCRLLAHFRTKQVRPKAMTQQAAKPNGVGLNLHGLSVRPSCM